MDAKRKERVARCMDAEREALKGMPDDMKAALVCIQEYMMKTGAEPHDAGAFAHIILTQQAEINDLRKSVDNLANLIAEK